MEKEASRNEIIDNKIEIFALGIDFANDYTQISAIGTNDKKPVSLSTLKGDRRYLIPAVLYKKKEINEWCIGDGAVQLNYDDDDDSQTVKNIVDIIAGNETVLIEDKLYSPQEIINIFFKELFIYAKRNLNAGMIHQVAITIENPEKRVVDSIYEAVTQCGFAKDNIRVISHAEAFIYYTINQDRDVWVNDVAVFDFNGDHFYYKRLGLVRGKKEKIIEVSDMDLSGIISMDMLYENDARVRADNVFCDFIIEEFRKHITSAVFLTGVGFYKDWAAKSLAEMCTVKRRVFKGYNLYVQGACYAAYKRYKRINAVDHIFKCAGRTDADIGLMIEHEGRNIVMLLSKAGTNWYDAGAQVECIVDNIEQIQFVFSPIISNIQRNVVIDLSPLPKRKNKTTRIRISIAYRSENVCDIEIKDLGFGDFAKATDVVIKETVDINDLLL